MIGSCALNFHVDLSSMLHTSAAHNDASNAAPVSSSSVCEPFNLNLI